MGLLSETLIISAGMIFLCGLPLFSNKIKDHSKFFFLLGTGALSGICLLDLLPDLFEMGGNFSLGIMGAVWLIYSIGHLLHLLYHREAEAKNHSHPRSHFHFSSQTGFFFLTSMMIHCFTSGMLLVLSFDLSRHIGRTVFLALLAHKGYEALTVSSVLIEKQCSKLASILPIFLYSVSLPAGVSFTLYFRSNITKNVAVLGMSLAVGTLLGCLIFDFLIPSFAQVKNRRYDLGWIVVGLVITQVVMRMI